jgi:hypothetical protein
MIWKSSSAPFGDDLDVAEFVQAEQVEAAVAADDAGKDAVVGGFGELVDQAGGGDAADPAALLAGGLAQADQQAVIAGAAVAEQRDRLAGVQVGAGGQAGELAGVRWRARPRR